MHFLRGYMDGALCSWSVNRRNDQCSNTPVCLVFNHFICFYRKARNGVISLSIYSHAYLLWDEEQHFQGGCLDYCKRMTGLFFRGEIKTVRDINGYDWKVIVDPTRSGDDLGVFYDGLFHKTSLGSRFETITPIPHCLFSFLDRTAILCTVRT